MIPPVWRLYLAAGVVTAVAYLAVPDGVPADVVFVVAGVSSFTAVVLGVRRHRPESRGGWGVLAAGLVLWVAGDTVYSWYADVLGIEPFPSAADVLYLAAYPVLAAGLGLLVRRRGCRLDVPSTIDAAVVTIGIGLLVWVVLAVPVIHGGGPVLEQALGLAYPAGDVVLLAFVVRLAVTPGLRTGSSRLLVAAFVLLLAADGVFALMSAELAAYGGGDVLFLLSYVVIGAAALHPSAGAPRGVRDSSTEPMSRRRLVVLASAVLLAPATLAVQLLAGVEPDAWAVIVASSLLFVLVVARMHAAIREIAAAATQRDQLRGALAHQAAHDSLTALVNRVHAVELVQVAIDRRVRTGATVGVLFVDLDDFKSVNDTFGHRAGDRVLKEVSDRLRSVVRAGDVVGRLGGDEFVVLVEAVIGERALVDLGQRIVETMSQPLVLDRREVVLGASVGIALHGDGRGNAAQLLHGADLACYRAKQLGRGRVEVYDEQLRSELRGRRAMETAIRRGLELGEFTLAYQPVVSVGRGCVESYEALLRWNRPGHGAVPPDVFIPVAEHSDLICDVDRWVLHRATRDFARWSAADPLEADGVTIAVNISARHLADASLVRDVEAALRESGLPASALVLEITETVLVDQPTAAARLGELRGLGVAVSIDDFGSGYTSIGQMQSISADTLKIDRSLVASRSTGADALVQLVITAAHAFGMVVVAEGVEEEEQLAMLRRSGCDSAQGYLFARPQPHLGADPRSREAVTLR